MEVKGPPIFAPRLPISSSSSLSGGVVEEEEVVPAVEVANIEDDEDMY
jgi:hypothetical protein